MHKNISDIGIGDHLEDSIGESDIDLLDIGVEPYLVSSSLLVVVAQRLVRTICSNCKEHIYPSEDDVIWLKELQVTLQPPG